MPRLSDLMITISGNPTPFLNASASVRREYAQLERDLGVATARMSGNMVGAGRMLTFSLTAPIIAATTAIGKMSIEFGQSMSRISGLTAQSREQVAAWRSEVLKLAGDTARAPKELADALYFISSSGIKASQAMDVLTIAAKASASGLGNTEDIAHTLTSVMAAYSKSNLTASQTADILVSTVREGNAEISQIGSSIGHVASLAAEMGISFNDVGAAIAAMTRVGLDGSESVTALKRVLGTLLEPSAAARKELDLYGLSAAELRKEASQNLIGALMHVKTAMHNNVEAVGKVFGSVKGLTGMLSLTGQQASEVQRIFGSLRGTTGDLAKAFDEASSTPGFKLQAAFTGLKASLIEFGDSSSDIIVQFAKVLRGLSDTVKDLNPEQRKMIVNVTLLTAAVGPALIVFGELGRILKTTYDGFILLRSAQVLLGVRFGATATEALRLTNVLQYMWIAATPYLPAIAGVAALGLAIYGIKKAYDAANPSVDEMSNKIYEEHKVINDINSKKLEMSKRTLDLVKEYNSLKDKVNKTTEEKQKLRDILVKINVLNPDLIKGYKGQATELTLVANAASIAAEKYRELFEAQNASAKQIAADNIQNRATERTKLLQEAEMLRNDPKMHQKYQSDFLVFTDDPKEAEAGQKAWERWKNQRILDIANRIAQMEAEDAKDRERLQQKAKTGGAGGWKGLLLNGMKPLEGTLPDVGYDIGAKDVFDPGPPKSKKSEYDKLMEDYESAMQSLRQQIFMTRNETEAGKAEWALYHGELSKVTDDGRKLSEEDKKAMIEKAKLLDYVVKTTEANRVFKESVADVKKQQEGLNVTDALGQAHLERKYGKYKDLTESQWNYLRGMIQQLEISKSLLTVDKSLDEARSASAAKKAKELSVLMEYYVNIQRAISEIGVTSEAGKAEGVLANNKGKLFGIDFAQLIRNAAKKADALKLSQSSRDDVASMQKEVDLIGKKTRYEKELWEVTSGKYKDLSKSEKEERLNLAKALDEKELEIDKANAFEKALQKVRDRVREIRIDLVGLRFSDRVDSILRESEKDGKPMLTRQQAEVLAREEERVERLRRQAEEMKTLMTGLTKVTDGVVDHIWNNGFRGLFTNILSGFRNMMREIASEYLKMFLRMQINRLIGGGLNFGSVVAGAGFGGAIAGGIANGNAAVNALASGGRMYKGMPTLVGERGPELIFPQFGGSVVNHEDTIRALNNIVSNGTEYLGPSSTSSSTSSSYTGGSSNIGAINVHIHGVQNSRDLEASSGQILGKMFTEMQKQAKRNNRMARA